MYLLPPKATDMYLHTFTRSIQICNLKFHPNEPGNPLENS